MKITVNYFNALIGLVITNYLSFYLGSAVIASALVGLVFSLFYHLLKVKDKQSYSCFIYIGSFMGMLPKEIYSQIYMIVLMPLLALAVYYALDKKCIGFGGRMGTIAFLASMFIYILGRL